MGAPTGPHVVFLSKKSSTLLLLFALLCINLSPVESLLRYGCELNDDLCEPDESCINDGVFGQCAIEGSPAVLILQEPLSLAERQLLKVELSRLVDENLDWKDAKAQCVLTYFKLSVYYDLAYDPNFCYARNPENIWALLQLVQIGLNNEQINQRLQQLAIVSEAEDEPGVVIDTVPTDLADNGFSEAVVPILVQEDEDSPLVDDEEIVFIPDQELSPEAVAYLTQIAEEMTEDADQENAEEPNRVDEYLEEILDDQDPDMTQLSDNELDKLSAYIEKLQSMLNQSDEASEVVVPVGEIVEEIPEGLDDQQQLLKKDIERFEDSDLGLANIEHKIVKGDQDQAIQRVIGDRVYLKLASEQPTDEGLYKLTKFLDKTIALPNDLYFTDFDLDGDQLSFKVLRMPTRRDKVEKRVKSAEGVAEAVYKRRKDIQSQTKFDVQETGIGSGEDVVPVESGDRDWLLLPILFMCAFTIVALGTVLAVNVVKSRRQTKTLLPELADQIDGNAALLVYQDLCRQRVSSSGEAGTTNNPGLKSKTSSTSSWCDEPISQPNMDISTGHAILTFMQDFLSDPQKIEDEWAAVKDYSNTILQTTVALSEENQTKNRFQDVVPYDDNLVQIQQTSDVTADPTSGYINASMIYDVDPYQPTYIATQAPTSNTTADFWQMIWEKGSVLIVNLCTAEDVKEGNCTVYWPANGSQVQGAFEIHLVSEHIWSEDYIVRSFYLKNLHTGETRTITQFHFLTWKDHAVPEATKSVLEFRRKVNKSYRGRASPILVHCSDGAGRTGTYCLLDVTINRISRGIKELSVAGSFEYLRDQRMRMIENSEQYKFVFSCVAEEVSALLKALS